MSPRSCPGDRDRVLGERAGDFLQRQAALADLDEVVKQPGLLPADAVIQGDQKAVQPTLPVPKISSAQVGGGYSVSAEGA
jgi:hypothetical protein